MNQKLILFTCEIYANVQISNSETAANIHQRFGIICFTMFVVFYHDWICDKQLWLIENPSKQHQRLGICILLLRFEGSLKVSSHEREPREEKRMKTWCRLIMSMMIRLREVLLLSYLRHSPIWEKCSDSNQFNSRCSKTMKLWLHRNMFTKYTCPCGWVL